MKYKKLLSIFLSICLVVALLPSMAFAATIDSGECGKNGDNVTWKLTSDGTMTISGTGQMQNFNTYSADENGDTTIFRFWRSDIKKIKKVIIEEGVTSVGDHAFFDAENLVSIDIADSVTYLGFRAFAECPNLKNISFGSGLLSTGSEAFLDCDSLTTVTLPNADIEYGDRIFGKCDGITYIEFPEKLTIIWEDMFENCTGLTNITIPNTVTTIMGGAFEGCSNLKAVTIPNSVTTIGSNTFAFCSSIQEITIPASVTEIGDNAFWCCSELSKVTLSEGLLEIGSFVFSNCEKLKEVVIPSTVTHMRHTFQDAVGLESVKFLGHAPVVTSNLFANITVTAYYPSNVSSWGNYALENYGGTVTWVGYTSDLNLSATIDSGTCGENLSWALTDSYTLIISGTGAMYDYVYDAPWRDWQNAIQDIVIEEGVTKIGTFAFETCSNLKSISIPSSIQAIGSNSFIHCVELTEILFNGDAPTIDMYVFDGLTANAYYPSDNPSWTQEIMDSFGGNITWLPAEHIHNYTSVITAPTCTEKGYTTYTCNGCEKTYISNYTDATGHKWDTESTGFKHCSVCGFHPYRIDVYNLDINATEVWVDGVKYPVVIDGEARYIDLKDSNSTNLVIYTYNDPDAEDIHTQYPTGMRIWILDYTGSSYECQYIMAFENLLQYSGSSIRITGKKGIRMITSISKNTKKFLVDGNYEGFTLVEYGTVLSWASDLEDDNPLILGESYAKSNYAYKRGVADPIYKTTSDLVQYTNVLVGFDNDQCKPDIAMRPYIILEDRDGNQITIYGGIIYRSIGYIAYQNRNAFKPGTSSYEYVWSIIHHVYGSKYDSEYKG